MGEDLKALMGDAYHENITVEEIENFVKQSKVVSLASGKYVDKSKYDRVEQELAGLKESTKDYEEIKAENQTFKTEKADATLKEILTKYGVAPESFRYVKGDIVEKILVIGEDESANKKAVEEYLKTHPQFAKAPTTPIGKNKVITTKVTGDNETKINPNTLVNDNIRRALGKKTKVD